MERCIISKDLSSLGLSVQHDLDSMQFHAVDTDGVTLQWFEFKEDAEEYLKYTFEAEILAQKDEPRKTVLRRTLVRIERVEGGMVEAYIVGWSPKRLIQFHANIIPSHLRKQLQCGTRLVAHVNTGCDRAEDLVFECFELAPEPHENDGLA